ncbi:MAG: heme-binding domain-containing protein, partial [Bacteroidota bacterium]
MKNQLKWVGFGLLAVLVILQFFQTDKTNKETDPNMELLSLVPASAEVADLLERACQDCHSNKTKYPWYSYIAPVSFWVKHH